MQYVGGNNVHVSHKFFVHGGGTILAVRRGEVQEEGGPTDALSGRKGEPVQRLEGVQSMNEKEEQTVSRAV